MPYESGIWRPHRWEDWELELIDSSLDTVGLLDEAVGWAVKWGIYGYGDGSLSIHIESTVAEDFLAAGNWYIRSFRDGVQIRDFMLAKDDRGYTITSQYLDEYIMFNLVPLDQIFLGKFGYPDGGTDKLTTPAGTIDDNIKWMVDHVCGPNAYDGPGASSRAIPGLTIAADTSSHPVSQALDQGSGVDLYQFLQKYGVNWDVDWRVRLEKTGGIANQMVFETFYPSRGVDKTEGNGVRAPIIINDASGEITAARRYRPAIGFANVVFSKDLQTEVKDAASIALYGRHEIQAQTDDTDALDMLLKARAQRIGFEFDFAESEMMSVGQTEDWEFEPGDEVTIASQYLSIPAENSEVQSIQFTLDINGEETIGLTFGRYEKTLSNNIEESSGGGGLANDGTPPSPVELALYAELTRVPFTNTNPSYVTFESADLSTVITGDVPTNTIDLSVPGALLWDRDTAGDPFLYPANAGDDVKVGANIWLDSSTAYVYLLRAVGTTETDAWMQFGSYITYDAPLGQRFFVGGVEQMRLVTTTLQSRTGALRLGDATYQWNGAYFNNDVRITAANKGVILNDNTLDYVLKSDGTRYIGAELSMDDLSDGHDAVTLSATLNSNLLSLTGQELGLDTQSANTIFAGPTSGGAAAPTFRAMVLADLADHKHAINGNTNPGTASGTTSDWTAGSEGDRGWIDVYDTDQSTKIGYIKSTSHTHTFSSSHTHALALNTGTQIAP